MKLVVDGTEVYCNTGGVDWQPQQPVLCLVHGASLDHTVWVLLARYFARHGYNVLVPDLPAHGQSGGELPGSIEGYAGWLIGLLDHLDVQSPKLAGHSMGSLVALEAAAQLAARVSHLVLLGTAYPMPVGTALLEAAQDNHHAAIEMVTGYGHAYASHLGGNPVAGINIYQSAVALMEAAAPGVLYNDLNACGEYTGGEAAARAIAGMGQCHATLILGAEDQMTHPSQARELAVQLGAEVESLPGCGHMLMSERPEQTLQAMRRALMR